MKKIIYKYILLACILALYFERELACRNLAYWVNNDNHSILENLWLFTKPYQLVLLTFLLVYKKPKLSIIPITLGIIRITTTLYLFITKELWQYNNFEDYELFTPYDSHEIRTIFTISVKIVFYLTSYLFYIKTRNAVIQD